VIKTRSRVRPRWWAAPIRGAKAWCWATVKRRDALMHVMAVDSDQVHCARPAFGLAALLAKRWSVAYGEVP